MKAIRVLILVLIHPCIYAQGMFSDSLSLRINADSFVCSSPCKTLPVSISFLNNSKEDILTYGLGDGPYPAPFSLSELCELETIHTGLALALYQSGGKQELPEITIYDRSDRKPVTREFLDSVLRASQKRFLTTKRILVKNETVSFVHELPLDNLRLAPGLYYLQMVYYCGNKIFNVLDMKEVKKSPAKLFQGCTMSNKVPFVVK